jgi:hypothetical protein
MRTLIKLAVGAAIAGALVNLLVKRRSLKGGTESLPAGAPVPPESFTLQDLAGENREWGGGSSGLNS